jgi:IrrE N-terminal-like domain
MALSIDIKSLSRAEALLWSFGVSEPEHIDLDAIAFAQGAMVRYHPLDGCAARLIGSDRRAVITINSRDGRTRQRFSLAHELAHWMQDRGTGSFLCAKEDIGAHNEEAKGAEASANAYASQLVLPNYLFDPIARSSKLTLNRAAEIGDLFGASLTAAAIKLVKRAAAASFVICHTKYRREWFIRGSGLPDDVWVREELHADTLGFTMLYGSAPGISRDVEEPAARWVSGPKVYATSVRSQSVLLSEGRVLSLVTLVNDARAHRRRGDSEL